MLQYKSQLCKRSILVCSVQCICYFVCQYIPEKGEDESQRETNMVVQDWEEKMAEHLLLNACSFGGACINVE